MVDLILFGENIRGRSCGGCKSCCTILPVAEISKLANQKCASLNHRGCKIYQSRPISCRFFSCRWLFDPLTSDLRRPDQAGYVIDSALDTIVVDGREVDCIQVWVDPTRTDSHKDPALRDYLNKMGAKFGLPAMIRFSSNDAFFLCPPSLTNSKEWFEKHTPSVSPEELAKHLRLARATASAG